MDTHGGGAAEAPRALGLGLAQTVAVLSFAALLLSASAAKAWKYHEHVVLGRASYQCACKWLLEKSIANDPEGSPARQALAWLSGGEGCPLREPPQDGAHDAPIDDQAEDLIENVLCSPTRVDVMAERYGQATALAADHLEKPELFERVDGQRDTVNLVSYAAYALHDGDHFHPRAPQMWSDYHLRALERAESARNTLIARRRASASVVDDERAEGDERARRLFWSLLYVNAFGDHYLQDSFSSGHVANNRGATRPTAAQTFHDKHGSAGRVLRDGRSCMWASNGDGQLHWFAEARSRVIEASSYSLYDVLRAFATGRRSAALGNETRNRMPIAYCRASVERCRALLEAAQAAQQKKSAPARAACSFERQQLDRMHWVSLDVFHTPTTVEVVPGVEYRHAFELSGADYLRNQIDFVVSLPFSPRYGLRVDLALGLITPAFQPSPASHLYSRAGITIPIHASYGSVLSIDAALGGFNEVCIDQCRDARGRARDVDRGLAGAYLGPHLNLELGRIALVQAVLEPFLAADYGGNALTGIGISFIVSKGTRVYEPEPFPGPPI